MSLGQSICCRQDPSDYPTSSSMKKYYWGGLNTRISIAKHRSNTGVKPELPWRYYGATRV